MAIKIGIVGSGQVAQALANGFVKYGYDVMLGSRMPEKLSDMKEKAGVRAGTFAEAATFGDSVVLALKGTAAEAVVTTLAGKLADKTVIDVTNPIADLPPQNGVLRYFTTLDESLMERLQKAAPKAKFVKAFNSVGNAFMVNPDFGGVIPTMFIAGDDENAKKDVTKILKQFGWETADMGGKESARAIEPLCILWCIPGFLRNEWMHAFKLLKK